MVVAVSAHSSRASTAATGRGRRPASSAAALDSGELGGIGSSNNPQLSLIPSSGGDGSAFVGLDSGFSAAAAAAAPPAPAPRVDPGQWLEQQRALAAAAAAAAGGAAPNSEYPTPLSIARTAVPMGPRVGPRGFSRGGMTGGGPRGLAAAGKGVLGPLGPAPRGFPRGAWRGAARGSSTT